MFLELAARQTTTPMELKFGINVDFNKRKSSAIFGADLFSEFSKSAKVWAKTDVYS